MIAFVDSSVFLRFILRQPMVLPEWPTITLMLASSLLRVESCRTLDRFVHKGELTKHDYTTKLADVDQLLAEARVLDIDQPLLFAASRPLPVRLATLDAIHLATAERFRDEFQDPFLFATHDGELAAAARAVGFEVIGSPELPV